MNEFYTLDPRDLPSLAQLLVAIAAASWTLGLLWGLLNLAWSYMAGDPKPKDRKRDPPGYF